PDRSGVAEDPEAGQPGGMRPGEEHIMRLAVLDRAGRDEPGGVPPVPDELGEPLQGHEDQQRRALVLRSPPANSIPSGAPRDDRVVRHPGDRMSNELKEAIRRAASSTRNPRRSRPRGPP